MALRGNLKDFSLPDVFQLVTLSGKSGILRIKRSDGAEGGIWFRDGEVFFAQSNWQREPLGERLVEAGRLTPAALEKTLAIRRNEPAGGRRLGQILIDEGYISEKLLEAFVQEQIQDTIFDLMRWDEGDFWFDVLDEASTEDIGLSVSIENIVMEGSRRLEEWNRIRKKIPSTEMVFKMATAPGEGTFEISLKPVEWNLLLLVDGTRTVSELAADTNGTDFEVARILYGLFSAGLLEVATDEEVERLRAERSRLDSRDALGDAVLAGADTGTIPIPEPSPIPEPPPTAPAKPAFPAEPAAAQPAASDEPAFLSGPAPAGSAEDMAVFEQMLGAVLSNVPPSEPSLEDRPPEGSAPAPPVLDDSQVVEPMGVRGASEAETPRADRRTGDLARDLMALGLGELPSEDLLSPIGTEEGKQAPEPVVLAPGLIPLPPEQSGGADLGELIGSLAEEADAASEMVRSDEPDKESAEDGTSSQSAGGVISTDAFMAEFENGGLASRGLGDELTALTGGGTAARPRPSAQVSKLPEPGQESAGLRLDRHVDKELVLKIIEGIEKL